MKKLLLILVLFSGISLAGCSGDAVTVAGSTTGLAATARILEDLGSATDREKALILANRQAIEKELDEAQDEQVKAELEAKLLEIKSLEMKVEGLNTLVKAGEAAAVTNWSDPQSAGPTIGFLASLALNFWQRRSHTGKNKRLDEKTRIINELKNGKT